MLYLGCNGPARVAFFGTEAQAKHVVYVIENDGSMTYVVDAVHQEVLRSIERLNEGQTFHIIFLDTQGALENPPKKLVPATPDNVKAAKAFLERVIPQGKTNPTPGIRRAFEVFEDAGGNGKLIFLMANGDFPNNKEVLDTIAELNKSGNVRIDTFLLYGPQEHALKVLKKISEDSGGQYKELDLFE